MQLQLLYYTCYKLAIGRARRSVNYNNPTESFGWTVMAYYWLSKLVRG